MCRFFSRDLKTVGAALRSVCGAVAAGEASRGATVGRRRSIAASGESPADGFFVGNDEGGLSAGGLQRAGGARRAVPVQDVKLPHGQRVSAVSHSRAPLPAARGRRIATDTEAASVCHCQLR